MAKIGFLGMGNMGQAMLKGILSQYSPLEVAFTDIDTNKMKDIRNSTGAISFESNAECANNAKYIILAVKPQYYDSVLKNIELVLKPDQVIISIAPGITIETLKTKLGADKKIVRAMPNTPALVGEGMTGIAFEESKITFEEREELLKIFSSFGKVEIVPENLMSAVVCASGSSPAYVYMFIEALADSIVAQGMSRESAYKFVAQSVMGSAKMVLETGEHPAKLKDMVCSPAGTTIKAVAALEEYGMRAAIIKASEACYNRAESIK